MPWRFLSLPLTFDRFLKSIDVHPQPEAKGATPSPSQALVPRGNGLILLVEDNATNQILAQTQLEQLGYRVHVAENGAGLSRGHAAHELRFDSDGLPHAGDGRL